MCDYVTNEGTATFIRRLMKWAGTEFSDDAEWAEREILRLRNELAAAKHRADEAFVALREAEAELAAERESAETAKTKQNIYQKQYAESVKERDKLREALETIAHSRPSDELLEIRSSWLQNIAHVALEETGGDSE